MKLCVCMGNMIVVGKDHHNKKSPPAWPFHGYGMEFILFGSVYVS